MNFVDLEHLNITKYLLFCSGNITYNELSNTIDEQRLVQLPDQWMLNPDIVLIIEIYNLPIIKN